MLLKKLFICFCMLMPLSTYSMDLERKEAEPTETTIGDAPVAIIENYINRIDSIINDKTLSETERDTAIKEIFTAEKEKERALKEREIAEQFKKEEDDAAQKLKHQVAVEDTTQSFLDLLDKISNQKETLTELRRKSVSTFLHLKELTPVSDEDLTHLVPFAFASHGAHKLLKQSCKNSLLLTVAKHLINEKVESRQKEIRDLETLLADLNPDCEESWSDTFAAIPGKVAGLLTWSNSVEKK